MPVFDVVAEKMPLSIRTDGIRFEVVDAAARAALVNSEKLS